MPKKVRKKTSQKLVPSSSSSIVPNTTSSSSSSVVAGTPLPQVSDIKEIKQVLEKTTLFYPIKTERQTVITELLKYVERLQSIDLTLMHGLAELSGVTLAGYLKLYPPTKENLSKLNNRGISPIQHAITKGNLLFLQSIETFFLNKSEPINWNMHHNGDSLLHNAACSNNNTSAFLLERVNPYLLNKEGQTFIHIATIHKNYGLLLSAAVMTKSATLDRSIWNIQDNKGDNALFTLIKQGNDPNVHKIAELLLEYIDPSLPNTSGDTAFDVAGSSSLKNITVLKCILNKRKEGYYPGNLRDTCFIERITAWGQPYIDELLNGLTNEPVEKALRTVRITPNNNLSTSSSSTNSSVQNDLILHSRIKMTREKEATIQTIVAPNFLKNVTLNQFTATNQEGDTPLHLVAMSPKLNEKIIDLFFENRFFTPALLDQTNVNGRTPIFTAVIERNIPFLQRAAKIPDLPPRIWHRQDKSGDTVLHRLTTIEDKVTSHL